MDINIQALINLFKESIGIEAAEKIVYEAIKSADTPIKTLYTVEEYTKICDILKERKGFIKTIATIASTSAYSNLYYQQELAREKKAKEDLARLSQTLEQKVEERTKELKELQIQMFQSAKMAAVGQLSAGIAHEINNPLSGILGYSQLILSKLKTPDFSAEDFKLCKKCVEYIEIESQRCNEIVKSLTNFSRMSIDKMEEVDIKTLIDNTVFLLRHSLEVQRIEIKIKYGRSIPLLKGNANRLQQVFTNMIINAQQSMPDGGRLNISVRHIKEKKIGKIEISFQDTGCGIPKEDLEKIFDPFFTTKNDQKSLGLGLSICYRIVQQHKGEIRVFSSVNKGAAFKILLPCG